MVGQVRAFTPFATMVQPGEKFGNYEVLSNASGAAEVLGSGSGGTTLKVRHVHLDTIAAVKILRRRAQASSREGQGFLSEARSAASLTHPHIARILDFGENAAQLYYVMDLCEGGSLEDFRNRHGVPAQAVALTWLYQAASALAHAHGQNILHRDIKPSNLLIAREGEIASLKLIDFGLAGKTDPEAVTPSNDPVIGTPLFAAPEQLRGQAEKASDVFSLGASFLWLLTGSHLDTGDLAKVIDRRLSAQNYGPLLATLPLAWQEVLGAFLAVDPAQRTVDGTAAVARVEQSFAAEFPLQPVAWSLVAGAELAPAGGGVPEDPAEAWEADESADWKSAWTAVDAPVADGERKLFKGTSPHAAGEWDVQLFEHPDDGVLEALVTQGYLLKRHAANLGLGEVFLRRGEGWRTVAWPALTGQDALDWLRSGGVPPAAELLPRIRPLAAGLDGAARVGLEAFELHPALLHLLDATEAGAAGFAINVPLPQTAQEKSAAETASTISGSVNAPLPIRFAACLYHLLGGRPAPPAAFLNNRAYPAVPRLSERSNRYLGQVIAGVHPVSSCAEIVDRLSMEERLPGATGMPSDSVGRSMFSTSASMTSATTVRQMSQPAMVPSETLTAPPQLPSQTPPSVPVPAVAKPATATTAKKPANVLMIVGVIAVVGIVVLGGGAFAAYQYFKKPSVPVAVKPSSGGSGPATASLPEPVPTPVSNPVTPSNPPATAGSSKLVKVPGDAATLADAIVRCSAGGTIELAGGTYKEAVAITKPLTIAASGGAVLENTAFTTSLLAIKGKVEVRISGLVIRDPRREATGEPEDSPPLVLVTDGGGLVMDGCTLEGGMGTGISLINRSSGRLSLCRILNNRWFGVKVSSGSTTDLAQCSIQLNRCGVLASDPGSVVTISAGSIVTNSSKNGVEIDKGGMAKLSGCEVSNTQSQSGVTVSGANSLLDASGKSSFSDNKISGIELKDGGGVRLDDCQIERNGESGIHGTAAGPVTATNTRFASGGSGIFIEGGSGAVKISNCDFSKHSDGGVMFTGVQVELTGSHFKDLPVAAVFGAGAAGTAKGNHITPGPADAAFQTEDNGTVTRDGNVAD